MNAVDEMDVPNGAVRPTIERDDECLTHFMVHRDELRQETMGSYLESISEIELKPGAELAPYHREGDEFYYILSGEALVSIGYHEQRVSAGELVRIPRDAVRSLRPSAPDGACRALAFAVGFIAESESDDAAG